ncbi:MAG: Gfo/Idh/MocA family protein [Acidimicrobiales bacterium]
MVATDTATNVAQHAGQHLGRPLRVAVAGLGGRGATYAELIATRHEGVAEVVQIAEPRQFHRRRAGAALGLGADAVFADWRDLVEGERIADAVIIATQDHDHRPAIDAFATAGYDILCEKPVAATEHDCAAAVAAAEAAGVFLGVCHVLRYTPNTRRILSLVADGAIGDIVAVQHLEPVGWFHFAHSFVRGAWRREDESGPLLLTKSCHDLDWLSYVVGAPASRVSSFGSLSVFTPANKPALASDRCITCAVEADCPYSAVAMYRAGLVPDSDESYFTRVMAPVYTSEAVDEALRTGPYGRCVYDCDNDAVDHQVVNIEYANGVTASFTLSAFTRFEDRRTSIFGTRGQITTDGRTVELYDFVRRSSTLFDVTGDGSGHGGGDAAMLAAFVDALHAGELGRFTSHGDETLATHRIVFAAERARRTGTVVAL